MAQQDTSEIKRKIVSFIQNKGPSLPVHIAKEIGMSMLFTSAFLSELISEKRLKMSNMRVGSSKLYLIPGQEEGLERFSQHLKSKEKEAFEILKEKGKLKDSELEPAIKVAIREIKDFAIPKEKDGLYWEYLTYEENKSEKEVPQQEEQTQEKAIPLLKEVKEELRKQEESESEKIEEKQIEETPHSRVSQTAEERDKEKQKKAPKKPAKKRTSDKKNEKFFNTIKEYLAEKNIEISDIIGFSKDDLTLKINEAGEEKLLIAYNKKTLKEDEILKAYKKAEEQGLEYDIISLGEPLKRVTTLIEAIRKLKKIRKIE